MRLTPRGITLVSTVVLAVASASIFGARGLNAIAAPGLVALGYAAVQVWRVDEPRLARQLPRHGEQGSTVPVELHVDVDRSYSARVSDVIGDGLDADGNDREVTLGAGVIRYELFLRRRGDQVIGPVVIEARDILGLVYRRFEVETSDTILVRPAVYPLAGPWADELVWRFGGGGNRQEFDFLRHYQRGDPLRDVHWRSSAKLPGHDFVVKVFSTDENEHDVRLAGESATGHTDEMAAATASIAVHLLAAGIRIGLETPDRGVPAQSGIEQRDRVLDVLARTPGGPLRDVDRQDADVLVEARPDGVTVTVADATTPFRQVAGREVSIPPQRGSVHPREVRSGGVS